MMRLLPALFSPAGRRARLSILIFHRVLPTADELRPGDVDAATFDWQMALMAKTFNVLPLAEACVRLKRGTLPARSACITFDDGYADNIEVAVPILARHGLHATFFVASGYLDGGRMWNDSVIEWVRGIPTKQLDLRSKGFGSYPLATAADRRSAIGALISELKYLPMEQRTERVDDLVNTHPVTLPTDLMMTHAQVRDLLAAGMEVGGHTVTHPILARIDTDAAYAEIADGKRKLEEITGRPIRLFAYPNGKPTQDYSPEHVRLVREMGFEAAVSTVWGAAHRQCDLFQLPRFTPWQRTTSKFQLEMLRNYTRRGMPTTADALPSA